MEGWSVFLNLENLLGVRQTRWDPLLLPAASPLGLPVTDAWAPLEGFTLNAGIRIRWGGERHHHDGHDPHDHDEPHR
jgi:iron complex outermembrane receptor protein